MKKLLCLILVVFLLAGCLSQTLEDSYIDLSSWVGVYTFSESYFSEDGPWFYQSYGIAIFEVNGEYFADFSSIGRMGWRKFATRVEGDSEEINFLFYHSLILAPEHPNFIEWTSLDEGDIVLTFRRDDNYIITTWGKMMGPMFYWHKEPGIYFEYVGEVPDDHFEGRYKQPAIIGEG